jgi:apolipoprotein N-acyltransferase
VAVSGGRHVRTASLVVAVAVVLAGFGLGRISWTAVRSGPLSVALVQGAVPQELKWLPEQLSDTLGLYRRLTLEALGTDLIVWPEAAIPDYFVNQRAYFAELEQLAGAAGSELMFGMLRYDVPTESTQNAVFTLGQPESVYVKRHLVPYGEYFPVPGFVRDWLRSMELPNIDTEPGNPGQSPVAVLGEQIAVTICYEDVFGAEQLHSFPVASLLVNVSNDGWFGDSIAPHQHLQIARMRSLEVGRWQLRATNTGVTALIDPQGRVVASLPQFEPGVLRGSVTGMTGSTPYIAWGNWPIVLLASGLVAAGVWLRRRRGATDH